MAKTTPTSTFGSLLQTVSSTANMVTGVVEGVSETGLMFQDFMKAAREKQLINIEADMATYATRAIESATITLAESRKEIADFVNASEVNAKIYKTAEADLLKAIAARREAKGK